MKEKSHAKMLCQFFMCNLSFFSVLMNEWMKRGEMPWMSQNVDNLHLFVFMHLSQWCCNQFISHYPEIQHLLSQSFICCTMEIFYICIRFVFIAAAAAAFIDLTMSTQSFFFSYYEDKIICLCLWCQSSTKSIRIWFSIQTKGTHWKWERGISA